MTNLDRLNKMSADDMANFILQLLRDDGDWYEYRCGNCPARDCGYFKPIGRRCREAIMTWLREEV